MEELLKELGLNGYEIKIYQVLLQYGKLDAKSISAYSNVPPTAVYPNLKNLARKKLIQQYQGKISYFEPLNPKLALDSYLEEEKTRLNRIKDELVKNSKRLYHSKNFAPEKEILSISQGKEVSKSIYFETLERVKEKYYILGWRMEKVTDKYTFIQQLKKAIARGVEIRIILVGEYENKNWNLIEAYKKAGIRLKYLKIENFSLLLVDEEECKITLKDRKLSDRYNIKVLDSSLAKALNFYFLEMWKKAKEIYPKDKLKGGLK